MRTILHVDMNAYFASVEQASNPFLRGKPVAVGGGVGGKRSIVAAASYEAKARGIKTAMPAWEALKICPDLIIVAGDMNKYIYTSSEINKILRKHTPQVEVFSIDEAFLDVTGQNGVEIARSIKRRIRERFKLTCSIGIGPNKLLAKLAGELKKPDGLMVLSQSDVPAKIKSVEVSKLCGVGRKLEKHLKELGIKTCGDLYVYPREKLVERFGPFCGEHLWQMGQGRDNSPVLCAAAEEAAKSMGHSYTLLHSTSDRDEVKGYLLRLAEQVGRRLRRAHYKGKVVHLSLGFGNFHFWGKQKKVGDYLDDGYDIFKVAATLFDRRQATGDTRQMRFVGVTISGLVHNVDQISLLPQREEKKRIAQAVDALNDRFGESTVERAATLKTIIHQKTGMAPPNLYK